MIGERGLSRTSSSFTRFFLPILAAVLVVAAVATVLWRRSQDAVVAPNYQTARAVQGNVTTTVTATGPVSASQSIPLSFESSGKIIAIPVQIGQKVTAGKVLAQQDTTNLENSLNQAKSSLAQQQANLKKLQQGATPQAIAVAQAAVDSATSTLANAHKNLTVVQASNATDLASAQTAVDNAQQSVQDAVKNLATTRAEIAASQQADQTAIANAQTALSNAQKNLDAVQAQIDTSSAADRTAVENAQTNLANAQKAVTQAQQAATASAATQSQQIAKAKNDLYTAQINRDAACNPRNTAAQCQAGNASVNSAQTGVDSAMAAAAQSQLQGQQAITQAQSQVDQASASLKTAQDALNANVAKYHGNLVSAQSQVDQAGGALKTARDTLNSNQAKNASTIANAQQAIDQANANLKTNSASLDGMQSKNASNVQAAQAQIDQATRQVASAKANLDQVSAPPTQVDLDAAQAQVQNAEIAVQTAQNALDGATIKAPVDGTVSAINGTVGQEISGGATGAVTAVSSSTSTSSSDVITLTDLNKLQVTSQVNESDMASIKVGDAVTFTIDAFPNRTFQGKVVFIQPQGTTTQNVVNFSVTSSIDSGNTQLLPGMTANVTIVTAQQQNVLTVPSTALSYGQTQLRQQASARQASQTPGARTQTGTPGAQNAPVGGPQGGQAGQAGAQGQGQGGQRQGQFGGGQNAGAAQGADGQSRQRGAVMIMKDGKPSLTFIVVGLNDGKNAEVISGLNAGDEVITGTQTAKAASASSGNGQAPRFGGFGFFGGR